MSFQIDFQPLGRRVEVEPGTTILEAAQSAGIGLSAVCGGVGLCGRCLVRPAPAAPVSPLSQDELTRLSSQEMAAGLRLACQVKLFGSARVEVPPESLTAPQRTQVEGEEQPFDLAPEVTAYELALPPAASKDLRADWERLADALSALGAPRPQRPRLRILAQLTTLLRENDWRVRVGLRRDEVVNAAPPGTPLLGLAVDLGTTKVAAYLIDLLTGRTLAMGGVMNPQIAYGEDVLSRISFTMENPEGSKLLQKTIVHALAELAARLCVEAGGKVESDVSGAYDPGQIAETVIVGNTAMHHLLLKLPVRQLGLAPYVAAVSSPLDIKASEIGLDLGPGSTIHLLPNIAGFVGGDHAAMLLATGTHRKQGVVVSLDIGTNTEITLAARGRLMSCSTASGPAFEGAHIRDGMRAAEGAIERVRIVDGRVEYQTIGGVPPVGVCGSGVLEALAQLKLAGILDVRGAMDKDHPLVRQGDFGLEVVLAPAAQTRHGRDVVLSRKDISEIQLAKGAIRTGLMILLKHAGLEPGDVDEFIIAGAFGTYIDVDSAVTIGMFPRLSRERFRQVGNAAGIGAKLALLSSALRTEAADLAARIEYLDLTQEPGFLSLFAESMEI